jgi:hypothetical protein
LQESKRGVWRATAAIIVVGLLALVWAVSPTERKRREVVERLEVGDSVARVEELLGRGAVHCPVGSLQHLEKSFPAGWPASSIQSALQAISRRTRERWVYPLSSRHRPSCTPADGVTEIGVGADGRLVWYVAVTGKTTLTLPDDLSPAGPEGSAAP